MKWSKAGRITAIVCGTFFAVSVLVASVLSGSPIDAGKIFEIIITGIAGVLAGMGIAAGPSPRGPVLALCIAGILTLSACGGIQRPKINPCDIQKGVVMALGAGVSAVGSIPRIKDNPNWEDPLKYADGIVSLGEAATKACILGREDAGWQQYVGLALETALMLAARFGGANDETTSEEMPDELRRAILLLGAETAVPETFDF